MQAAAHSTGAELSTVDCCRDLVLKALLPYKDLTVEQLQQFDADLDVSLTHLPFIIKQLISAVED